MATHPTPTLETYNPLDHAYTHFNSELFAGELPACLITLQRKGKRIRAYFSPHKFENKEGTRTDEIALNPMHFNNRNEKDILSSLVHEMAHLWQHHFGKVSRHGYHNKEWAAKMKQIGLHPSNTGTQGGKETGDSMTHFIVERGPYEKAVNKLLARGFSIQWKDSKGLIATTNGAQPATTGKKKKAAMNSSNRVKYTCGKCQVNAWGKFDLKLVCGECMETMHYQNIENQKDGL